MLLDSAGFTRKPSPQPGGRLLVRSTCEQCGEWRVGTYYDGSLQQWEDGHNCRKQPVAVSQPKEQSGTR
jgi:hypothetical protein